ncbi:FAD-dependent monooxygenase [Actinoplanes friuliensis]|uniref:3-(3-hydroxy-phenyl)propionate hydroxylase n=1 Tax=Actinoplanes friuliensis DSM 7358 TaxID=1246995 RepID=U5W4E8_9ACTN|nr:FAD-dependent monooxygenase [Actinoplanes friuliensis]AGZ42865.1 3-(3-hydroxy-phenyl)propionate hydroxylase [Actinoplanes friuliensis DSM 7358]
MDPSDTTDTAVIVAGMGPVGAALAALLSSRGVPTVVVEPQDRPYPKPRAAVLDIEAIRALSVIPGMPPLETWATPLARNGAVGPDHRPLFLIEHTALAYGLPQIVRLDQPALEAGLRAAATKAEVLSGRGVSAVEQDDDRVTAVLDDGRRVTARWLVGCDGTGSTVRTAAGVGFPGETFEQPWLVVDAAVRPGAAVTPGVGGAVDGGASIAFVLDPARPQVAMSQRDRWRWEWMLLPGEEPHDEIVRSLISAWVDPADLDIERTAVYTFYARTAERWRAGRVLLAGDAAHAMPPFAGLGLGMGIRDVIALAWRLADVVDGGDPHVLDAYERERRPDVERSTALALRIGRLVQTRNRTTMRLSRGALRALASLPGLRSRLGREPMPARRLSKTVAGPLPDAGRVLPNPRVSVAGGPPVRLDEVIRYRWVYIGHGCDPRTVAGDIPNDAVLLALHHPDAAPGCLPIDDLDGLLAGRPGSVTVARPDRFLHGTLN